jgi:hypothetical protein
MNGPTSAAEADASWKEPVRTKTLLCYFLMHCGYPLSFYLGYIYFNPMLKDNFGLSTEDIILHNLYLSLFMLLASTTLLFLSAKFHPLRILRFRWIFTFLTMLLLPLLITNVNSSFQLLSVQALIVTFNLTGLPADAVFYYHLPIFRRFTLATFLYALSRTIMYVITSFGLVYLGSYLGVYGLWALILPITFGYLYGIIHFEELERNLGFYPSKRIKLQGQFIKRTMT